MYILSCPSCQHETQVKFARKGARATCRECQAQYELNSETMVLEPGTEADTKGRKSRRKGPLEELVLPPGSTTTSTAPAKLSAVDELSEALDSGDAPQTVAAETAPPTGRARERRSLRIEALRRQRQQMRTKMGIAVAVGVGIVVLLGILMSGGEEPPPNPPSPPPVVIGPDPPVPPTPPPPPPLPQVPVVELAPAPPAPGWLPIEPPQPPMAMNPALDIPVVQWEYRLDRDDRSQRAMIHGLFVADTTDVHEAARVRVQLLDSEGQAYAELEQDVPVLCARQGLEVRLPVPMDLLDRYRSLRALCIPRIPIANAGAVETDPATYKRLNPGQHPRVMELSIRNPHDRPLVDPILAMEISTARGWPLGTWEGRLTAEIEPGGVLTFQASPPLSDQAAPGRLLVRGYGMKQGLP